jgi:glutamyl-tRNA synthetase
MNGWHLAELAPEVFVATASEYAPAPWREHERFTAVCALMQTRTKLFTEVSAWTYFFADDFVRDEKAVRKFLGKEENQSALAALRTQLADCTDFSAQAVEACIHAVTDAADIKRGKLNQPLRVALTGTTVGAGIYETAELLGKACVLRRLEAAEQGTAES